MSHKYSAEEISHFLAKSFAAPLIISTIGFIIYGINGCLLFNYFSVLAKRDHIWTRLWVALTFALTSALTWYQVYVNWSFSINVYEIVFTDREDLVSLINGNSVALYSSVIMLVQLFWLGCIWRLMSSNPKVAILIIAPIAFTSVSAFLIGGSVGVLSNVDPGAQASWPNQLESKLLRVALGLDLGVDIAILLVIISQMTQLRKSTESVKKTITKLTYVLCAVTFVSILVMIAELVVEIPVTGSGHALITINITFAPMIAVIYCFGMLSVLNARTTLFEKKRKSSVRDDNGKGGLLPGMTFTSDVPGSQGLTRDIPLENSPTFASRKSSEREG